jgi:hypothetical protein
LKQLIDQVRVDLKQPNLPWFISEQHPNAPGRNIDLVNSALNDMARTEPGVTILNTSQLPHARLHFGTRGTLLLGEEMANANLQRQ